MSELQFCRTFLSALDARPIKLSSDHIADARQYPAQSAYTLPRLPHPPHPTAPTSTSTSSSTPQPSTTPTLHITLKPLKPTSPTIPLPSIHPSQTSIFDLKASYARLSSLPAAKIKILYKKKPVADSKTVAEVVGSDVGGEVEFGVMVMGGGAAAGAAVSAAPAASGEPEKDKEVEVEAGKGPAAQGPSGKEVVAGKEFWDDLKGFVIQRIRDEGEGERLVGVFRKAWEAER